MDAVMGGEDTTFYEKKNTTPILNFIKFLNEMDPYYFINKRNKTMT